MKKNPFEARLAAFAAKVAERKLDAAVVFNEANIMSLTGVKCDNACLLVPAAGRGKGECVFFTDFRYVPAVEREAPWIKVAEIKKLDGKKPLKVAGISFGGVGYERIQITENSLENPGGLGGLNSFADITLRFPHSFDKAENYERGLDLDRALAYVRYDCGGVHAEREYFASYPDRTLAGRICTSSPVSFAIGVKIPFLTEEEGREKRGTREDERRKQDVFHA